MSWCFKKTFRNVLQAISQEDNLIFYHAKKFGFDSTQIIKNETHFAMVRFGNVLGSSVQLSQSFVNKLELVVQ